MRDQGWRTVRIGASAILLCTLALPGRCKEPPRASDDELVLVDADSEGTRDLSTPLPKSMPRPEGDVEAMPIDWPTVLELARASNVEIRLAAERVNQAHIQLSLARSQWIPSLKLGTTWLHHDGAIQDIPGNVFNTSKSSLFAGGTMRAVFEPQKVAVDVLKARQQIFARSGALDRATRQTLQEVSMAYVDLVAAQAGAAISIELSELIGELVKRSEELLRQGVGAEVEVLSNRTRYQTQLQLLNNARQNQLAASAQLGQLLSLPANTRLFAAETQLTPITLVDEKQPEDEMLRQAHAQGPGLAEVVALITALDEQKRQLRRIIFLPTVTADVGGGSFGGGFGGRLNNFDNASDYGVAAYWDVLKLVGTAQTRELFESQRRQASMQYEDITRKLEAGVIVARNAAVKAKERLSMAETEISMAVRAFQLSDSRLKAAETVSPEVMQAIGALGQARSNYLKAVIDYNRAQITLQYLLGQHCNAPEQTKSVDTPHTHGETTIPRAVVNVATDEPKDLKPTVSANDQPALLPTEPTMVPVRKAREPRSTLAPATAHDKEKHRLFRPRWPKEDPATTPSSATETKSKKS